jgi:glycosidase
MHIILDGVFNHTGDDSVYFNKHGTYKKRKGAYQSTKSSYYKWYTFTNFPDTYEAWWGIPILPRLNTQNPEVENFLAGDDGIVAHYMKKGVSGFRLDVADELPDKFLETLRKTVKKEYPEGVVIGEVWENAADKCAYGKRRSYFRGKQLDGVMNYPIKHGIVEFVNTGNARCLYDTVCDIYTSYPHRSALSLMNVLGTHDTERILTVLSTDRYKGIHGDTLAQLTLTPKEYETGSKKLICASVLQFTLPGVPSVFYGDEAGVHGGHDPFCRKTYPWGKEDRKLIEHYTKLGKLRCYEKTLGRGELEVISHKDGLFEFKRMYQNQEVAIAVNCSDKIKKLSFTDDHKILYGIGEMRKDGYFFIEPYSFVILKK